MHIKQFHKRFNHDSALEGLSKQSLKDFAKSLVELGGRDGAEARRWFAAKGIKV